MPGPQYLNGNYQARWQGESGLRFTEAELQDLPSILSRERLDHWVTLAGQPNMREWRVRIGCPVPVTDTYGALLHEWNSALSFTLLASLQMLEISVRNHINAALIVKYQNAYWWGDNTSGRFVPSKLIVGNQRDSVSKAIDTSSRRKNRGITPGGVVSELSFGFWLALLGPNYNNAKIEPTFWIDNLDKVFNKRGFIKREVAFKELEDLVRLRNKCAHHDSIIDLDLNIEYNAIVSFARRFSKTTADWIAQTSLVPHLLRPEWLSALKVSGRLIGLP